MGEYRILVKPEVEAKMTTVTVTISTAIRIVKARKAGIPRWKAWRERNHAAHLLIKKAYRDRNLEIIRQKDRERKRQQKLENTTSSNAQSRTMSMGVT